jgi:transposase
MIATGSVGIYIALGRVDLRGSFDRLAGVVREQLRRDPMSGALFIFAGRGRDRVKILFWDRTGYCILYKRLEKRVFEIPAAEDDATSIEIDAAELRALLVGVETKAPRRKGVAKPPL